MQAETSSSDLHTQDPTLVLPVGKSRSALLVVMAGGNVTTGFKALSESQHGGPAVRM